MWFLLACATPEIAVAETPLALAIPTAFTLPQGRRERWSDVPPADGFTNPVDEPDARVARGYGEKDHLGIDVNARGSCDDDLGVLVMASASGVVSFAGDLGGGWGNVVQIVHRTDEGLVQTLYAHLDRVDVARYELVERRQVIGTMGNAHGVYCAHLHFEVRADPDADIGGGYASAPPAYQRDPDLFLRAHAPGR